MAVLVECAEVLALSSMVLLLLLNSQQALEVVISPHTEDGDNNDDDITGEEGYVFGRGDCSILAAIHHVRMLSEFIMAGEDLGYWV
jgi:hypothetical protein